MKIGDLVRDRQAEWRGFGVVVKNLRHGINDLHLISVIWPFDGGYRTCGPMQRYEVISEDR